MTATTPMNEFLTVAERKVSDLFACAKHAPDFLVHCQAFDSFMSDSSAIFSAPNPLPADEIRRLKALQQKLVTIELVANTNAGLVSDMPEYVDQSINGLR